MSKLRIGIIGCGLRATTFFRLTTDHFKDSCELVAICDKYQTQMDKRRTQ